MIIAWRYKQEVEILRYDLDNKQIMFKCLSCEETGDMSLKAGEIYTLDFSCEDSIPDIIRITELIDQRFKSLRVTQS